MRLSACRLWVPGAFLTLFGCADGSAPVSTAVVRDSAGITIVETAAIEPQPAPWTVAAEPHWTVGAMDGDEPYLLGSVTGALEVAGGETVIANRQTNELRFFDDQGVWTRTLGGTGEGPGEFEYLRALAPCHPDGFVAFDLNWQRNAYRLDGTFVDKTVLRAPSGITPYALACDPDGNVMLIGWGREMGAGPVIGFHQTRDRLVLTDGTGQLLAEFGERLVSERIGHASGSGPHPAGRATRFALHDGRAYIGSGRHLEVEVWGFDGRLQSLLRGPTLPLAVTDSVRATYVDAAVDRVQDPERTAAVRRSAEEMEWPETLPAFTDLAVDDAGVVWLKRFKVVDDGVETWSLLHPETGYIGDLSLAAGHSLLDIEESHLLVLTEDDLGVERVAKVALDRGMDG